MTISSLRFTSAQVEVVILALTLLATVIISAMTLRQTTFHFETERTSAFVARFNGEELVSIRERVDRWLETGETPAALYDRSRERADEAASADALRTISQLRTMANYFQEFGTALKTRTLNETYAHLLMGGVSLRYAQSLTPFIMEAREEYGRPTVYEEVLHLERTMAALDR